MIHCSGRSIHKSAPSNTGGTRPVKSLQQCLFHMKNIEKSGRIGQTHPFQHLSSPGTFLMAAGLLLLFL